MDKPDDGPEKS